MNVFGYTLIIITILLTILIGIKKPDMHSRIFIYDSNYIMVDENDKEPENNVVVTAQMPTMPVENTITSNVIEIETKAQPKVEQKVLTAQAPVTIKTTNPKKIEQVVPKTSAVQQTAQIKPQEVKTVQSSMTKTPVTVQAQTQKENKQSVAVSQTPIIIEQPTKVLTEQEEIIAWNIWRSNLQNQIMKDSRLPNIPVGTVFKVSFTVDKYGKVSNVQTWSTNSQYTPYAIEFIAPVIRSYQGKPILKFPEGSQRTKTDFSGGWKIAHNAKYSNPGDFNDMEKVVK